MTVSVFKDPVTKKADFRDLMVAAEIFKDTNFDEKMVEILGICDIWQNFYLNFDRIFNVFKIVCTNKEGEERLRHYLLEIIENLRCNPAGYFSKQEFLQESREHAAFNNLIDESIKKIKKVDKLVENDLEEKFNTWIPLANNM